MASTLTYTISIQRLQNDILQRNEVLKAQKCAHFIAARKIQAWFRGILTRKYLSTFHKQATVIQCHWRAYHTRMNFEKHLICRAFKMWDEYYHTMATRIQALWRGYWIRKTQIDFPKKWAWLKTVYLKNNEILESMKTFKRNEIDHVRSTTECESMLWILFILFKLHHMLRTKCRPGVITKVDKTHFTFTEQMLKCLKYRLYIPHRDVTCEHYRMDVKKLNQFRGTYLERCEREIRAFEEKIRAGYISVRRSTPYNEKENIKSKGIDYQIDDIEFRYDIPARRRREKEEERKKKEEEKKKKEGGKKFMKLTYSSFCECQNESKVQADANSCSCNRSMELYEAISSMNCHLHRLDMQCPIHDHSFSHV